MANDSTSKVVGQRRRKPKIPTPQPAMPKIHEERRGGVIIGYRVDLGKDAAGRRQRPFVKTREEAEQKIAQHQKEPVVQGDLWEHRYEFLRCLQRCNDMGVSIEAVVNFYEKHRAVRTRVAIETVIDAFIAAKREARRKQTYLDSINKHLTRFANFVGPTKLVEDILEEDILRFTRTQFKDASDVTVANVFRNLSVLFGWALRKDYIGINPMSKIDRPEPGYKKPHILTPEDFQKLLERCYRNQWYDRLTVFILVGFCGVRTSEAAALNWHNISLETKTVYIPDSIAKARAHRTCTIPDNAIAWLRRIEDKRLKNEIIGVHWQSLLRTAIKFAHIDFKQNAIRHSYCSYAFKIYDDKTVRTNMGHVDESMIHKHYKNPALQETDAKKWFSIEPPAIA